jgi:hypothetical protein
MRRDNRRWHSLRSCVSDTISARLLEIPENTDISLPKTEVGIMISRWFPEMGSRNRLKYNLRENVWISF